MYNCNAALPGNKSLITSRHMHFSVRQIMYTVQLMLSVLSLIEDFDAKGMKVSSKCFINISLLIRDLENHVNINRTVL